MVTTTGQRSRHSDGAYVTVLEQVSFFTSCPLARFC
jgi:hypothetical protein